MQVDQSAQAIPINVRLAEGKKLLSENKVAIKSIGQNARDQYYAWLTNL
jgi:hypothetical protein